VTVGNMRDHVINSFKSVIKYLSQFFNEYIISVLEPIFRREIIDVTHAR